MRRKRRESRRERKRRQKSLQPHLMLNIELWIAGHLVKTLPRARHSQQVAEFLRPLEITGPVRLPTRTAEQRLRRGQILQWIKPLRRAMTEQKVQRRALAVNISVTFWPDRSGSIEYRPHDPSTPFPSKQLVIENPSELPPIFGLLWLTWNKVKPHKVQFSDASSSGLTAEDIASATTTTRDTRRKRKRSDSAARTPPPPPEIKLARQIEGYLREDLETIDGMHPKSKLGKYKLEIIELMTQLSTAQRDFQHDINAMPGFRGKQFKQKLRDIDAQRAKVIEAAHQIAGTIDKRRSVDALNLRVPGSFEMGKRR